MKAAILHGMKQKLNVEETEFGLVNSDHEAVQVLCASLNHRDYWIQQGKYAGLKFPIILGSDLCGIYNGKRVIVNPSQNWGSNEHFQSSQFRILGLPDSGSLAEYVSVPKNTILEAPAHLSDEECAALPLASLTAFRALFIKAKLEKTDSVLITGIGGGVSLAALQLALPLGCNIFVSSSSNYKIEQARILGSKGGVNYNEEDWDKQLIEMSNGGVDVIIDGAAGNNITKLLKIAKPGARLVMYGGTAGVLNDISPQIIFWKQIQILGTTMGSDKDFELLMAHINRYKVKPIVDRIFELNSINFAFERMAAGEQFGKIVIKVANA